MKPYSLEKSFGQYLLQKLTTDTQIKGAEWYIAHYIFGKSILLLSDRQVQFVNKDTLEKKWKFQLKRKSCQFWMLIHDRYQTIGKNRSQHSFPF